MSNVWIPLNVVKVLKITSKNKSVMSLLTPKDIKFIRECKNGNKDLYDNDKLYNKLYEYYLNSGEMPIGVAKSRDGQNTDEWILDRLEKDGLK